MPLVFLPVLRFILANKKKGVWPTTLTIRNETKKLMCLPADFFPATIETFGLSELIGGRIYASCTSCSNERS